MAIGARISSTNLSGKTATVTFTPYTGATSGTTVNLGSKTVPFNNLTAHPYGVYSLYFAEYDYTYTLTVEEPLGLNQSYVFLATLTGGTTYATAVLNFEDLTATLIDFELNTDDWNHDDTYPISDKGYFYSFHGGNTYDDKLIIFTDFAGNIIEQYSGTTSNYDYDFLDGMIGYYAYEDLGILKYTDGISGYTANWTAGTGVGEFDQFDIEWDWDGANLDGKFVYSLYNTVTEDREFYLADHGTHTLLTSTDANYSMFFTYQEVSDVFILFTQNSGTNFYETVKIFNSTGSLIRTFTLENNYNSYNRAHFANNQFVVLFWNSNDSDIDYFMIRYDGNTNTYSTTTHERGSNYSSLDTSYSSGFWTNSYEKSSYVLVLYTSDSNNNLSGNSVTYCDIIYTFDDDTTLYTEVYQNSGVYDKSIGLYFTPNQYPLTHGNTGDGNFSTILLTTSGLTYNIIGPMSDYHSSWLNNYVFGEKSVYMLRDANDPYISYNYLISSGNTTLDDITLTMSYYESNYFVRNSYGLFYISNYTDSYYVNGNLSGFTSISGVYDNSDNTDYFNASDFKSGPLFLWSEGGEAGRVITSTSVSSELSFVPCNGNNTFRMGRSNIMKVYGDVDTNYMNISIYDLNGVLKNTTETQFTGGYDSAYSYKDRYVVRFYNSDDGTYTHYLVSEDVITSVTTSSYDNYTSLNDIIWWD